MSTKTPEQLSALTKPVAAAPFQTPPEMAQPSPRTFAEMLDPTTGTWKQRAIKSWITPHNPEGTIQALEILQVDTFLQHTIRLNTFLRNWIQLRNDKRTTNYRLADTSLNSLLEFATLQTTLNEAIHLFGVVLFTPVWTLMILARPAEGVILFCTALELINIYCVLAQRYTRAKMSLTIDKALKRNKPFSSEKYWNILDLHLPELTENVR